MTDNSLTLRIIESITFHTGQRGSNEKNTNLGCKISLYTDDFS